MAECGTVLVEQFLVFQVFFRVFDDLLDVLVFGTFCAVTDGQVNRVKLVSFGVVVFRNNFLDAGFYLMGRLAVRVGQEQHEFAACDATHHGAFFRQL